MREENKREEPAEILMNLTQIVCSLSTQIITCLCLIKHCCIYCTRTSRHIAVTTCNVHNYDYLPVFFCRCFASHFAPMAKHLSFHFVPFSLSLFFCTCAKCFRCFFLSPLPFIARVSNSVLRFFFVVGLYRCCRNERPLYAGLPTNCKQANKCDYGFALYFGCFRIAKHTSATATATAYAIVALLVMAC